MNIVDPKLDRERPWPGLAFYTEDERQYFFGRERETQELLDLLRVESIALLFGKSGLGKTSLLLAGLFPHLKDEGFLPVYVRINYDVEDTTPEEQVVAAIRRAARLNDAYIEATSPDATIWDLIPGRRMGIHSADGRPLAVALVFDQFEEIFTFGSRSSYAQPVVELVEALTKPPRSVFSERATAGGSPGNPDAPICTVLLSAREDFLPELESLHLRLPPLRHNRLRLQPLKGAQALKAINGPGDHLLDENTALNILDSVSAPQCSPEAKAREKPDKREILRREVNPALLSLLCTELNERRIELKQDKITVGLVRYNRETILREFLERSFRGLTPGIRTLVETDLVTGTGHRNRAEWHDALAKTGASEDEFETLEKRRLIVTYEDSRGVKWIELTHDILVDTVLASRRKREREVRERQTIKKWACVVGLTLLLGFVVALVQYLHAQDQRAKIIAQNQIIKLQAQAAEIGNAARKQSDNLLERAKEILKKAQPDAGPLALAMASRALERDQRNAKVIEFVCKLLLENTWCAALSRPLRYASETAICSATFSPEGSENQVLAVAENGSLLGWKGSSAELKPVQNLLDGEQRIKGAILSASFSRDARTLLTVTSSLAPGGQKAHFWSFQNGSYERREALLLTEVAPSNNIAWSPDGKLVILIPGRWDRVPVCQAFELQGSSYVNVPFPFGDSPTVAVAFSPTGKLVATADPAGVLRIWTWEDNTAVQANGASKPVQLTSTRSRPFSLVFSPIKDELLVTYMGSSGRMQVEVIDITTNKVRELQPPSARDQFLRFYFGPSNVTRPLLATALYGRMVLNDVAAIDLARPVAEPIMVVGNSGIPVFSSGGRKLLTLSGAVWLALDTVQLWDLRLPATPQNNAFQYDGQPAPDWLPNLARAVSGIPRAFDDDREPSPTLESVGAAIRSDTVAPAYAGLVHRFFPELRLND